MYFVYSLQSHLDFPGCIEVGTVGMEVRSGCGQTVKDRCSYEALLMLVDVGAEGDNAGGLAGAQTKRQILLKRDKQFRHHMHNHQ